MTRTEQLVFCKKCTNRTFDTKQGIICKITGAQANFKNKCPDYILDPIVQEESKSKILNEAVFEKFKLEQNFKMALISGVMVGIIGAILWGALTVSTGYQIGYMAIAIGAGVGFTMRYFGKGIDPIFGITGGIIAVLSCLFGNFFSLIGFVAEAEGLGNFETLLLFDYAQLIPIMTETFSMMDVFFYAIAAYEGYKFSFRVFTEEDFLHPEKIDQRL